MKIIKILFLGIVLVMFNTALLSAAALPDTVRVTSTTGKIGGTLTLDVSASLHTTGVTGWVITFSGLPVGLDTTAGTWLTWSPGFGAVLEQWKLTAEAAVVSWEDSTVNITMLLSVSVDQLVTLGQLTSKSGSICTLTFQVPSTMSEGTYALNTPEAGTQIMGAGWAILDDLPIAELSPVVIASIPDYDALQMGTLVAGVSGSTYSLPINVENKDVIASGSFTIDYASSVVTLSSVTAGTGFSGLTFQISSTVPILAATAANRRSTITFSGGTIAEGALRELCSLEFTVGSLSSGVSASVALGTVVLKDVGGSTLAALQQPTTPSADVSFVLADSLILDVVQGGRVMGVEGGGISVISNGKLYVPVRLVNTRPVASLEFWAKESPDTSVLRLSGITAVAGGRAANWIFMAADSISGVKVIGTKSSLLDNIAAGNNAICNLVYDIKPGVAVPLDVSLNLAGVVVGDENAVELYVQNVSGVATIDDRVPSGDEDLGPGASLPKTFALAQNHPNPFNPSTTISYQIPENTGMAVAFTLNVYDIRGSLVKVLASGLKGPGFYTAYWDGTDNNGRQVSSGVYFYRFSSQNFTATRKMILLK